VGSTWSVEERRGTAAELHASWPLADPGTRTVAVCRVTAPAVVLGSTQRDSVVDADRARRSGIEVARRRSGGGAVLVLPGDPVWIDAWVPRGDRFWDDDVARAFDWLGATWTRALVSLGCAGMAAHRGGYAACTRWSSLICFGGVGTGEVVSAEGRKVVGIAQRRTRAGAWFHSACVLRWAPDPLLDVLDLPDAEQAAARTGLEAVAGGILDALPPGTAVDDATVEAAFLHSLP
jgi:lipoate-protein ligase A